MKNLNPLSDEEIQTLRRLIKLDTNPTWSPTAIVTIRRALDTIETLQNIIKVWQHNYPPPVRERVSQVLPTLFLASPPESDKPWRCFLNCPSCNSPHIDQGEWATTRYHRTHLCEHCNYTWKPAEVPTIGVEEPFSCNDTQ